MLIDILLNLITRYCQMQKRESNTTFMDQKWPVPVQAEEEGKCFI